MGATAEGIVREYEHAFATRVGVSSAYAFWKGRTALRAILEALGLREGDEVIVPGFTCVVVPNAVRFLGATPVFVDIAAGTYNIDPSEVERAIGECNAGTYAVAVSRLREELPAIGRDNDQGEIYLTDIVARCVAHGEVATVAIDPIEAAGVNTPASTNSSSAWSG